MIPSGRSSTGLTMPKTPGSNLAAEVITGMGKSRFTGVADRSVDRSRFQPMNHQRRLATKPHVHNERSTTAIQFSRKVESVLAGLCSDTAGNGASHRCGGVSGKAFRASALVKGPSIDFTMTGTADGVVKGSCTVKKLPSAVSNEKGSRNLIDVISHNRCRRDARFFFRASVMSQTNAANRVVCQRWLARKTGRLEIISTFPFRQVF